MDKKVINIYKYNKIRCIIGIIVCLLIWAIVFSALIIDLIDAFREGEFDPEINVGINTFRMFTTISNLIVMFSSGASLPFMIKGLKENNYHLPKWIVIVLYLGTTGVALTFFTAITAISIVNGVYRAMFRHTNLLLHTLSPILSILLFVFINDDHRIKFRETFISLIPFTIYAVLYVFMVFILHVWTDHYKAGAFFPWPISMMIMIGLAFGASTLLRISHNASHKRHKKLEIRYYTLSDDFNCKTIEEAILKLASFSLPFEDIKGNFVVPRRTIRILVDKYQPKENLEDLCKLYIEKYYQSIHDKG